jgi:TolB-like protein/Flp pilus assembly protein TadD
MSLFSELKRRNVFRVALLYLVASWLIIQVADVGVSLLGLPDWTGRLVFLLLLIGLPLVVVFSWAYEITPEGLKREKEVERDESITHETARKLNTAVIVLLLIAVGGMIADRLIPEESAAPGRTAAVTGDDAPVDKSIAVLPFVNMSADPENEYFSDGLSEELLNLLAKIPELKVAARTSAFSFKDADVGIAEIADALNVAHVLEGSVRKSGDEIRITAQLIKGSDGYHLWSQTWDRTLVDVFSIQDEIAAAVVDALKVSLLGELPHASVTDTRAYELYLQAKAADNLRTRESMFEATQLLTQALAIDPDYVEAWVELGIVQTNLTGFGHLPREEGFARAKISGERALELDPTHAQAMSQLAWNAMYWDWDFDEATRLLKEAVRLQPGNASVLNTYAVLRGIFGDIEGMTEMYENALERDPVAMSVLSNLAGAYMFYDRAEDAAVIVDRIRAISPNSAAVTYHSAWLHLVQGEAEAALDGFTEIGGVNGDWGRAFALYDLGRDEELDALMPGFIESGARPSQVAMIEAYRGDVDRAFEWLARGIEERDDWIVEVRMYRPMDVLHADPRWEELLADIGISDSDAERLGL